MLSLLPCQSTNSKTVDINPSNRSYMESSFWLQKWATNNIGFHKSEANPMLVKHFDALDLPKGSRLFLPLCGKTRDFAWLISKGYSVAGAELAELAIEQLFDELGVAPQISSHGPLKLYQAENIDIFVGDIFALTGQSLGSVDAIYDRAAYVALPAETRRRYSSHLKQITDNAPQLLITFDYDQNVMAGPPFSIPDAEVNTQYAGQYTLTHLESADVVGGLKGICAAKENVWLLASK